MKLREILKRKMPATFNAAEYETGRILNRLDQCADQAGEAEQLLEGALERILSRLDQCVGQADEAGRLLESALERILSRLDQCADQVDETEQLLKNALERIDSIVDQRETVLAYMKEALDHQSTLLEEQTQRQKQLEEMIHTQAEKLDTKMVEDDVHKILYYCPHEVCAIRDGGFYEIRERNDYPARYLALIKGLDDESVHTVERLLCRHLLVRGQENKRIDLFTEEEKKEISRLYEEFYTQLLPLREGLFTWGGALFPYPKIGMGWTETTVLLDRCGFGKVRHPESVQNQCILDIGAFAGDSALAFSPLTKEQVYAFEASPANYELLCKTVEVNGLTNVVPVLAAVGDQDGRVAVPIGLSMGNQLAGANARESTAEVEMTTIDTFVQERELRVGMIKVDIEGMEMQFLKGAEQTIRSQRPALLLSIYHTADDFFGIKPLLESWNLGYRFSIHKEINEHIHYDTMLVAEAF